MVTRRSVMRMTIVMRWSASTLNRPGASLPPPWPNCGKPHLQPEVCLLAVVCPRHDTAFDAAILIINDSTCGPHQAMPPDGRDTNWAAMLIQSGTHPRLSFTRYRRRAVLFPRCARELDPLDEAL